MREYQRPTVEEGKNSDYATHRHPAYGVVRISNPQGVRTLFGSDAVHHEFVEIEIAPTKLDRGLNTDWIHGETQPIVSVAMSHAQFVSMIQSSGNGQGTPCTIQIAPKNMNRDAHRLPFIEPIQPKTELIKDEIEQSTKKALELALKAVNCLETKCKELKESKSVTKKDLSMIEPLIKVAQTQLGNLPTNLRFALTCAEETIDNAVQEAKMEIEASAENKLRQIGLGAIQKDTELDMESLWADEIVKQLDVKQPNKHFISEK